MKDKQRKENNVEQNRCGPKRAFHWRNIDPHMSLMRLIELFTILHILIKTSETMAFNLVQRPGNFSLNLGKDKTNVCAGAMLTLCQAVKAR